MKGESNGAGWISIVLLIPALALIDAALTFENVWPTPAIRWTGDLSVELAVGVLALAVAAHWFHGISTTGLRWLAIVAVIFVVGHYADVTSQALFGRPINLYWDTRHLTNVAAILIPILTYVPLRWALGQIARAMTNTGIRIALGATATVLIALFFVLPPPADYTTRPLEFAAPVSATYGRQVRLLIDGVTGVAARSLP